MNFLSTPRSDSLFSKERSTFLTEFIVGANFVLQSIRILDFFLKILLLIRLEYEPVLEQILSNLVLIDVTDISVIIDSRYIFTCYSISKDNFTSKLNHSLKLYFHLVD